jgi:hypothetical protein
MADGTGPNPRPSAGAAPWAAEAIPDQRRRRGVPLPHCRIVAVSDAFRCGRRTATRAPRGGRRSTPSRYGTTALSQSNALRCAAVRHRTAPPRLGSACGLRGSGAPKCSAVQCGLLWLQIGLEGSPDLAAAKVVADSIGTIHHGYTFTPQALLHACVHALKHARVCTHTRDRPRRDIRAARVLEGTRGHCTRAIRRAKHSLGYRRRGTTRCAMSSTTSRRSMSPPSAPVTPLSLQKPGSPLPPPLWHASQARAHAGSRQGKACTCTARAPG